MYCSDLPFWDEILIYNYYKKKEEKKEKEEDDAWRFFILYQTSFSNHKQPRGGLLNSSPHLLCYCHVLMLSFVFSLPMLSSAICTYLPRLRVMVEI